jgi:hypothetical protein
MISYQRLQNMSGFIEHIDKKLEFLTEDINLLLALQIAEPELKEEMINNLREASKAALDAEGGANESYVAQGD